MTFITHTRNAHASPAASVMKTVRSAFHALADWQAKRKAEAELMELDDRMLDDIGITRDEIHHHVWG